MLFLHIHSVIIDKRFVIVRLHTLIHKLLNPLSPILAQLELLRRNTFICHNAHKVFRKMVHGLHVRKLAEVVEHLEAGSHNLVDLLSDPLLWGHSSARIFAGRGSIGVRTRLLCGEKAVGHGVSGSRGDGNTGNRGGDGGRCNGRSSTKEEGHPILF